MQVATKTTFARFRRGFLPFFLAPATARPLGWLRIGVAGSLLCQAFALSHSLSELYGTSALLQGPLATYLRYQPYVPKLSALVTLSAPLGLTEAQCLMGLCGLYVFSLILLLVGFTTRFAAVLAWFSHWTLMASGHTTNYGADQFAQIFLFYMIFMPMGETLSLDALFRGTAAVPSWQARLSLRVLQIHLSLVYIISGFEKAAGPQWWDGDTIWRALMLPIYAQYNFAWVAQVPWFAKVVGWGTLVLEIFYPLFIWIPKTRKTWIALTVAMHIGIAVFLGLWVFGAIMSIFTLTLFGVSPEPKALGTKPGDVEFGAATPLPL